MNNVRGRDASVFLLLSFFSIIQAATNQKPLQKKQNKLIGSRPGSSLVQLGTGVTKLRPGMTNIKQHQKNIVVKKTAQPVICYQAPIPHWSLENKHQVIHLTPRNDSNHFIIIGKQRYNLLNLHFHYPSEHTVNGKRFPLEAHFVHENNKRELAVISVLIQEGTQHNSLYSRLISSLKKIVPFKTTKTNVRQNLDLATLLPAGTTLIPFNNATPKGSIPGINWLIARNPVTLNKDQIQTIKTCYKNRSDRMQ